MPQRVGKGMHPKTTPSRFDQLLGAMLDPKKTPKEAEPPQDVKPKKKPED